MDVVFHDSGLKCEWCGGTFCVAAVASYIRNGSDEPVYVCMNCMSKTIARMDAIEQAASDADLPPGACNPATGRYNPNVDGEDE